MASPNRHAYGSPGRSGGDNIGIGALSNLMHQLPLQMQAVYKALLEKESELERERELINTEKMAAEAQMEEERTQLHERVREERDAFKEEKRIFEDMKRRSAFIMGGAEQLIVLDVGGEKFKTDMRTLAHHSDSIFPDIVRPFLQSNTSQTHCPIIFIDRDSGHFKFILNFMRQGKEVMNGTALRKADHCLLEEMICEARYYGLTRLVQLLEQRKARL